MSNILSVLATKDYSQIDGSVSLFLANEKIAREYVKTHSHASSSFLETIADIDNAHFMTMYEMHALVRQLRADEPRLPPRDRLQAAKELAYALREKQNLLPRFEENRMATETIKFFPPGSTTKPIKKGTKMEIFLRLALKGTTIAELSAACGWAPSAVLSGWNYDLNKVRGFGYTVEKRADGVDLYKAIIPAHHKGPLVG